MQPSWVRPSVFAVLVVVASCGTDEAPPPAPTPAKPNAARQVVTETGAFDDGSYYAGPSRLSADYNHLIARDGVRPVSVAQTNAAKTQPNKLFFPRAGNDDIAAWEKGRIVVSAPSALAGNKNPFGFARRVVSVETTTDEVIVTTETVSPEDLFSGEMQVKFEGASTVDVSATDLLWLSRNYYGLDPMTDFPLAELPDEPVPDDPEVVRPIDDPLNADRSIAPQGFLKKIAKAVKKAAVVVVQPIQTIVNQIVNLIPTTVSGSTSEKLDTNGAYSGTLFNIDRTQSFQGMPHAPFRAFLRGSGKVNQAAIQFSPDVQMGIEIPVIPGTSAPKGWMNVDAKAAVDFELQLDVDAGLASAEDPNNPNLATDVRDALLGPNMAPPGAWTKVLYVSRPKVKYFQAGAVPVVVTMTSQLNLECGFEVRGAVHSTLQIHADTSALFGASVSGASAKPTTPTVGLKHSYSARHASTGAATVFCGLVPRVNVFLYDTVGIYGAARTTLIGRSEYKETCPTSYVNSTPEGRSNLSLAVSAGLRVGGRVQAPGVSWDGINGTDLGVEVDAEFWNNEWPVQSWSYAEAGIGYCTPLCRNGQIDRKESDIDCGSICSTGCAESRRCRKSIDCRAGLTCTNGQCSADFCQSNTREGEETDVDCGGPVCAKCAVGAGCEKDRDCASGVCGRKARDPQEANMPVISVCARARCEDHVLDGDETGLDCGGSCAKCANGVASTSVAGCASGFWDGTFCVADACSNRAKDGAETDVDCGGGTCRRCGMGQACVTNDHCQAGLACVATKCAVPPPFTVTAVSPNAGRLSGGTTVSITGTSFDNSCAVSIGSNACTGVQFVSATELTCAVPAGTAGAKNVVVTNGQSQTATGSNLYTYVAPPTVASVSPGTGATTGGFAVTLTGTGFAAGITAAFVTGNTARACTGVTVLSDTQLTCVAPSMPIPAQAVVRVTDAYGQSATMPGAFIFTP